VTKTESLLIVLGDQLFAPDTVLGETFPPEQFPQVFMAEDDGLCTHFRYHKKKLVFFLAAMRNHAEALRAAGYQVHYHALPETQDRPCPPFIERLDALVRKNGFKKIVCFEIEDRFFEKEISDYCRTSGLALEVLPSPMFLTGRSEFGLYLKSQKKPFMKTFYERQRKRLKVLVEADGSPIGGQWSFDEENRNKLPSGVIVPKLPPLNPTPTLKTIETLVETRFAAHPGDAAGLWCPVDRKEALHWLDDFLQKRLREFGDYEDAFSEEQDFLYHSALTPLLNSGLLTPAEVLSKTLAHAKKHKTPMNSLEGFVRQIMGWREFIRGIYHHFDERQQTTNFWNHKRRFKKCWYEGETGIPPLDQAIRKAVRLGYTHHIERLMVLGNFMLLSGVAPTQAHRWFMELYIDSADWVMGPNVYGMALFSDGGVFATKPYICGSNYLLKMGPWKKGDWCDTADGLYWRFIDQNREFFLKNPRLSMMARMLDKMDASRKRRLFERAEEFLERTTLPR